MSFSSANNSMDDNLPVNLPPKDGADAEPPGEKNETSLKVQPAFIVTIILYMIGFILFIICSTSHWCMCGHLAHTGRNPGNWIVDLSWLGFFSVMIMATLFINGSKYLFYFLFAFGIFFVMFWPLSMIVHLCAFVSLYKNQREWLIEQKKKEAEEKII